MTLRLMEDDDRPRAPSHLRGDAAGKLSGEALEGYSLHELDARVTLLEAEITRVKAHKGEAAAHLSAADALFGRSSG